MSSSTATLLYFLTFAACGAFATTYFTCTLAFDYEFEAAILASFAVSVTTLLVVLLVLNILNEWRRRQFMEAAEIAMKQPPPATYCQTPFYVATTPNGGMLG